MPGELKRPVARPKHERHWSKSKMSTSHVAVLCQIRMPAIRLFLLNEIEIPLLSAGAVLGRIVMAGVCGTVKRQETSKAVSVPQG